jgi:hypothetical protein
MSNVEWSDPPPPNSAARSDYVSQLGRFLAALREEPKRWARKPGAHSTSDAASSIANYINSGRAAGVLKGEFDATSRKLDDGTFGVWVRYVGTDTEP